MATTKLCEDLLIVLQYSRLEGKAFYSQESTGVNHRIAMKAARRIQKRLDKLEAGKKKKKSA